MVASASAYGTTEELSAAVALLEAPEKRRLEHRTAVDLRSDTVTTPTPAMRAAMALATVGDDVFEDDPTVNQLEIEMAAMAGKEAAIFVPTGTMGNLISVMVHCAERCSEAILGAESHICIYEGGGIAQVAGVHPRTLPNNADGTIDLALVEATVRADDVHFPRTRLLCLENTHNKKGGRVLSVEYMDAASEVCKKHNLKLHVDGARIFNAAASLGVPVSRLLEHADSASICLSKALGAPVGSCIVGSTEFIREARRIRKMLGGGMRQVGVLAAGAQSALAETPPRLAADHARARALAEGLAKMPALELNLASVESNLIYVSTKSLPAAKLATALGERGVSLLAIGPNMIRLACHHQVLDSDVPLVLKAFEEALAEC